MDDANAVSAFTQTLIDVLGAESVVVLGKGSDDDKLSGGDDDKKSDDDKNSTSTDDDKRVLKKNDDDKNTTSTDDDKSSDDSKSSKDDDRKKKSSPTPAKKSKRSSKDDDKEESIYQHEIKFRITFTVQSDKVMDSELLEEQYTQLLADKIADGTFIPALIANSITYGGPFNSTSCAVSDEFELISVVFDDSLPFVVSPLALDSSLINTVAHHDTQASYDYSSITLFSGAMLLGFVAFVGILARGMNGYDSLGGDSEHLDSSVSASAHSRHGLITGIEMDHSISNPLGRNAAHEADITRVSNAL